MTWWVISYGLYHMNHMIWILAEIFKNLTWGSNCNNSKSFPLFAHFHMPVVYSSDLDCNLKFSNYKVGCVFTMVIWSEFHIGQYRDDEDRENRGYPTLILSWFHGLAPNLRPLSHFGTCWPIKWKRLTPISRVNSVKNSKLSFLSLNCHFWDKIT